MNATPVPRTFHGKARRFATTLSKAGAILGLITLIVGGLTVTEGADYLAGGIAMIVGGILTAFLAHALAYIIHLLVKVSDKLTITNHLLAAYKNDTRPD